MNARAPETRGRASGQSVNALVAIPVYDHPAKLREVVEGALKVHPSVLVVDDGSQEPVEPLLSGLGATVLRHGKNRGKGAAILTAALYAQNIGSTHLIPLDADGQHDPGDIPRFLEIQAEHPDAIIVGERDMAGGGAPFLNRFGRRFSNFWLTVQTGRDLGDVQSGYRSYPLYALLDHDFSERGFAFEVEVLVRSAWAGVELLDLPVSVRYYGPGERLSHFNKLRDNLRLTLLNTKLTMFSMLPFFRKTVKRDGTGAVTLSPVHPVTALRYLVTEEASPVKLAQSAALGLVLGAMPLIGFQMITVMVASGYLKLNRLTALTACQLCTPPFVPALAVEAGHFMLTGSFLTEFTLKTLGYQAHLRLLEWFLGSLAVGPLMGIAVAPPVYLLARKALKEKIRAGN